MKIWPLIASLALTISQVGAEDHSSFAEAIDQTINYGNWHRARTLCAQGLGKNPDDVDARLARARLKSCIGKLNEAVADCNKALLTRPHFAEALCLRGLLLCDLGKRQSGQNDLKTYLSMTESAHDTNTLMRRAIAFEFLNDYKSRDKLCQEIVTDTTTATARQEIFNRGSAQMRLHKFKDALESFSKLKTFSVNSPRLLMLIAYCHSQTGESNLALQEFARVASWEPDAFNNEGGWGNELEKEKKFDEAIKHYDRALKSESHYLFALRHRAYCFTCISNNEAALRDLNSALALEPDEPYTLLQRIEAEHALGKHKEAVTDSRAVIAIEPKNSTAWYHLGDSLAHLERWSEACAACTQAIKLDPKYFNAFCNRAWAERELGMRNQAIADYTAALRIDPKSDFAHYSRGLMLRDEKKFAQSIADLSAAIKEAPNNAFYFCARGCSEVKNHDYQKAIEDCTESIKLNASRLHPYLSRGEAYAGLGNYDLALSDLNYVIKYNPTDIEALTERAKVYKKLKKPALAAVDLACLDKLAAEKKSKRE